MAKIVTVDTFARAETDFYFRAGARMAGGISRWHHHREVMDVHSQSVIRANRDTLYSTIVFDLDAGDVTVELPDTAGRFMSLIVIDEDHYVSPASYAPASVTLSKDTIGTRYAMVGVRTLVDPTEAGDIDVVVALQDSIRVDQAASGSLELPEWDKASQDAIRADLVALAAHVPDSRGAFGGRDSVDPVRHLIGTASGWGGNRESDATYVTVTPAHNDGVTPYVVTVRDVPVDGFWSIAVYNSDGYFEANDLDAYGPNSFTATKNADGSVTVHFGGDPAASNYVPITPGWNYWVRLYRPRPEILDGSWVFPAPRRVNS
ncbi:MAG: DUF1214 domain-containing protein [Microbacterium sp.]|nr:DUF1214 domain-containing protein [Microbacterium sp.]